MSLYDDIDTDKKSENVAGWASGIKLLQSHMHLKKSVTQPRKEMRKPSAVSLAPVIRLHGKNKFSSDNDKESDDSPYILPTTTVTNRRGKGGGKGNPFAASAYLSCDPDWQWENEYDPMYPNDYDKALKELRERRDREAEEDEEKRKKKEDDLLDEPIIGTSKSRREMDDRNNSGGVAIAPPPNLDRGLSDSFKPLASKSTNSPSVGGGANAAARIMAKYGYKEGQGLGKKEQGMATALQVEKTSHRTGRIIHEKDRVGVVNTSMMKSGSLLSASYMDEESMSDHEGDEGNGNNNEGPSAATTARTNIDDMFAPPLQAQEPVGEPQKPVRSPSKVVVLKNMVSPAEVDDELEPEVKEECCKYGVVSNVTIFQMPDVDTDDAIRIFVEFHTVDAAGKAVDDLDGRYFGGKQVRAEFYDLEKYNNLELTD